MTTMNSSMINGIDTSAMQDIVKMVKDDARQGMTRFHANTAWKGGFLSETKIDGWMLAGEHRPQSFTIAIDEPQELLGGDAHPNPQEFLMAAINACMLNTFVAVCSMLGVTLESVEMRSEGDIDLRGFLGLDSSVSPGYDEIKYTLRVKGDGTEEQYRQAHEMMMATSPNYHNMAKAIQMNSELVVE